MLATELLLKMRSKILKPTNQEEKDKKMIRKFEPNGDSSEPAAVEMGVKVVTRPAQVSADPLE